MERLTTWNGKKYVLPQGRTRDGESYWRIIADRLAAYENTGLDPEHLAGIPAGGRVVEFKIHKAFQRELKGLRICIWSGALLTEARAALARFKAEEPDGIFQLEMTVRLQEGGPDEG